MKKWVDNLLSGILGAFIVILLGCEITMIATERKNGLPSLFGYSFLYVKTDSMVGDRPDSLLVGDGIVIKRYDPSAVEVGDVITFYDEKVSSGYVPTHGLVTHRVYDIKTEDDGLVFYCTGDNASSGRNAYNIVTAADYKGTMVAHSLAFGSFLEATQETWFMPVTVFVPLGLLAIWEGIDIFRDGRKAEKEEQAQVEAMMAEAGVNPKDEGTRLLFEEKFRYKIELRREAEEAMKKERARYRKELAKARKKAGSETREETGENK
ncbi:MAG: hypothetical protein LKK13_05225 [Bacilli bacterium]|jgi:signal peptidase I|nr:hypothetical protein [Bacilli bacterium]